LKRGRWMGRTRERGSRRPHRHPSRR